MSDSTKGSTTKRKRPARRPEGECAVAARHYSEFARRRSRSGEPSPRAGPARVAIAGCAAASVAVLATGLGWGYLAMNPGNANGATLGVLAASMRPACSSRDRCAATWYWHPARTLRGGQALDVRGDSLVNLMAVATCAWRAPRSSRSLPRTPSSRAWRAVRRHSSRLARRRAFRVVTEAGEFRHRARSLRSSSKAQTRLRVREGSVLWRADRRVHGGRRHRSAHRSQGKATRRTIASAGRTGHGQSR